MTAETFFEKFETFADAPGAVAKMRNLILYLAVHGKLVEQHSDDEPASELLVRSRATMATLMATRKAKREKPAAAILDAEMTFDVPSGWTWARLVDAGQFINGLAFKPSDWGDVGRPIIRIQNLSGRNANYNRTNGTYDESVLVQDGDILVSWSATLDAFIWRGEEGVLNQHIFRVLPAPLVDPSYLFWLLKWVIRELAESEHAHGLVMSHINRGPFLAHQIPVPPLAEQKRIVAKVDELMALCDQLQAQQKEREEKHAALARASLARFAEAPTPANLGYLFHPSYTINPADLRKSILTLAVQGKLVPQHPSDRPATTEVQAARKHMQLPPFMPVTNDEAAMSFEIPTNWCWARVEDVADSRLGKMLDAEKNRGNPHPYLRNTNVHWFRFELDSIKTMLLDDSELNDFRLERGDVMICEGGHGIARSAVWDDQLPGMMFQKALHRVRPLACLNSYFFAFCLRVYEAEGILQRYYTGAGIPHFTGRSLAKVTFPLPPLAEQRRIVAKVDQLMALVDQLETQLAKSRLVAGRLMEAVVAGLTNTERRADEA